MSDAQSSWAHLCRECEHIMWQGCDSSCKVKGMLVNAFGRACIVFKLRRRRANEEPCSYASIGFLRPVRSDIVEAGDGKRNPKGCHIRIKSKKYEE